MNSISLANRGRVLPSRSSRPLACANTSGRACGAYDSVTAIRSTRAVSCAAEGDVDVQRRALVLGAATCAFAGIDAQALPALAETKPFTDTQDGFSLNVPADWSFAVPTEPSGVSTKRTLAWFPESTTDVNVTIVITTPGADYTSLASFGTASDFGTNLVTSMDRSFMLKKGGPITDDVQVAKLVNAKADPMSYFIEYTVQRGFKPQRHLYSRVALGENGRFRRLYTITAQCPEAQVPMMKDTLQAVVGSLKLDKATMARA